jgi:hypothetical protein
MRPTLGWRLEGAPRDPMAPSGRFGGPITYPEPQGGAVSGDEPTPLPDRLIGAVFTNRTRS